MQYINIISQIAILFLLISIGVIAGKTKLIPKEAGVTLSKILFFIALPCLIISAFQFEFSNDMLNTAGVIFTISMVTHGLVSLFTLLIFRNMEDGKKRVLRFITIFSNCGFIGYPVANSIYGSIGVFYAAVYNVGFNIFVWTIGIMIFQSESLGKREAVKKVVLNPGIISVIIGMIIFIFSIKLPFVISETVRMTGNMTIPLSMIIIGLSLCATDLKSTLKEGVLYYASSLRLIAIPVFVFISLTALGFRGIYVGIPFIVSAMPASSNAVSFAQIYGGDVECASKITVLTTLLSAVTIPSLMLLLR